MTKTANRRRKVEMPSGIRKKFTAALSMLLIAAIILLVFFVKWKKKSDREELGGE